MAVALKTTLGSIRAVTEQLPKRFFSPAIQTLNDRIKWDYAENSSSSTHSVNFLEEENTEEYQHVAQTLPTAYVKSKRKPWPTLFANAETEEEHDILLRLVMRKEFAAAKVVLSELEAAGVTPKPQQVYIGVAHSCLHEEPVDKEGFLKWMSLIPARPFLCKPSEFREDRRRMKPMVDRIRVKHESDIEFIHRFLKIAAQKGLLQAIFSPFISHLTVFTSPAEAQDIIGDTISSYDRYGQHTDRYNLQVPDDEGMDAGSVDLAQERMIPIIYTRDRQYSLWWHQFVRRLLLQGYRVEADDIYKRLPVSAKPGRWEARTKEMIKRPHVTLADPSAFDSDAPLPKQIRAVVLGQAIHLKALVFLLRKIEAHQETHPGLLQRFKSRYTSSTVLPLFERNNRRRKLTHAEITAFAWEGRHREAVLLFRQRFMWFGLPHHPAKRWELIGTKLGGTSRPLTKDINVVLPSLLALCGNYSKGKGALASGQVTFGMFRNDYIKLIPTLPSNCKPDSLTWFFIISYAVRKSIFTARTSLRLICSAGINPGESAFALIAKAYADTGRIKKMNEFLQMMENQKVFYGIKMPKPSPKTYEKCMKAISRYSEESTGDSSVDEPSWTLTAQNGDSLPPDSEYEEGR